jgi:hypothetical protein
MISCTAHQPGFRKQISVQEGARYYPILGEGGVWKIATRGDVLMSPSLARYLPIFISVG